MSGFVDVNRQAVETVKANLDSTRLKDNAQVVKADAFSVLKQPPDRTFDYIFIAPPQYKELWTRAITELDGHPGWLSTDAWVIVQIDPVEYQGVELQHFKEFDQRRYGSTLLVFYEMTGAS